MVASSEPAWFEGTFNALVGLFDRVGLYTNARKTVSMVCHPCQPVGNITQAAYRRRLTWEGNLYKEQQWDRAECEECREQLAVGSISSHLMTQHVKAAG